MNILAIKIQASKWSGFGWAGAAGFVTLSAAHFGCTLNQALALIIASTVLLIWTHNRVSGLIAAVLFFMVKPLFVRIAYAIDKSVSGNGGFDLLGITPALLLAGLIIWQLFLRISAGEKILIGRTRTLMWIFSAVAFLSIFNPANSILVGFAGFERNVLPNMLIFLTASFVLTEYADSKRFLKAFLVLGLLSCLYGIGQYFAGLYPWERDWVVDVAFGNSTDGWLTVGLKGVEFRLFSLFYNNMDFTFSNSLIFALVISYSEAIDDKWKKIRLFYVVAWATVLILSLERTPLVMSLAAIAVLFYLKSGPQRRKSILWKSSTIAILFSVSLSLASPYLKETGADKFIRLAELTNPLVARSVEDRMQKNWEPTLKTIGSNPLGVGMGFGSQTKANSIAAKTDFWIEPHNELLQKTLETGLVGGIIFLLLLISVFRDGLKLS
ncbi:MAG: O-antigen ligase family protein, partial [Candidatus Zixiibacteriota bacterium]